MKTSLNRQYQIQSDSTSKRSSKDYHARKLCHLKTSKTNTVAQVYCQVSLSRNLKCSNNPAVFTQKQLIFTCSFFKCHSQSLLIYAVAQLFFNLQLKMNCILTILVKVLSSSLRFVPFYFPPTHTPTSHSVYGRVLARSVARQIGF